MGTGHLAPYHSVPIGLLISPLFRLLVHPIDVGYPLAAVVCGVLPVLDSIELQEGSVGVLISPPSLVPNKYPLVVKPASSQPTSNKHSFSEFQEQSTHLTDISVAVAFY